LNESSDISERFFSITESGNNSLRKLSAKLGIKTFAHDALVGGRFSILSLVGLMPAAVSGVNIRAVRAGAAEFLQNMGELAAESAALHIAFMRKNIWQNVLMTYPDRLRNLGDWYRQIWAESLGKNGAGSTPIRARGTIDQHSQMQLYLGGRRDKFYNCITLNFAADKKISTTNTPEAFNYLGGKTLADVINAEQKATIETLVENGRPVRSIEIGALDERNLGMLIAHLMLETIIAAKLLGVNPFDQPAVEAGKIKTRNALR
jgi:glucose-6-phosphate isomerase